MPQKIILKAKPLDSGCKFSELPVGRHLHAMLLDIVRGLDPLLAEEIHNAKEKPFSLWAKLSPAGSVDILLSIIDNRLISTLQRIDWTKRLNSRLYNVDVDIQARFQSETTFREIWDNAGNVVGNKLKVTFLTPTSFRRAGIQIVFPEPGLLLKNVYSKATAFGGEYIRQNLVSPDEFSERMAVARYELATEEVNYGKYKIIGCTGYAVFDCRRININYQRQSLASLCALAEYTGIGYKTAMGMGRVECAFGG